MEDAWWRHKLALRYPCDEPEGLVYRVERKGKVDFLAKWVRPDKIDGKYLECVAESGPVWNWRPDWWRASA